MEQVEKYLDEIEAALYKMSPVDREHLMEVLHIAFPEYFKKISCHKILLKGENSEKRKIYYRKKE